MNEIISMIAKRMFLLLSISIAFLCLVSAQSDEIHKLNEATNLTVTCDDGLGNYCDGSVSCYITVTDAKTGTIEIDNQAMTRYSSYYNYAVPSDVLTYLGEQQYNIMCTDGTYSQVAIGSFEVTATGTELTQSKSNLIIAGFIALFLFSVFFFSLALIFKHPATKIFLMALSTLSMIILIGLVASSGNLYLAEIPSLITVYNSYYIVVISLAGAAMIGLLVWLIYYAVTLFNKTRGRIPED